MRKQDVDITPLQEAYGIIIKAFQNPSALSQEEEKQFESLSTETLKAIQAHIAKNNIIDAIEKLIEPKQPSETNSEDNRISPDQLRRQLNGLDENTLDAIRGALYTSEEAQVKIDPTGKPPNQGQLSKQVADKLLSSNSETLKAIQARIAKGERFVTQPLDSTSARSFLTSLQRNNSATARKNVLISVQKLHQQQSLTRDEAENLMLHLKLLDDTGIQALLKDSYGRYENLKIYHSFATQCVEISNEAALTTFQQAQKLQSADMLNMNNFYKVFVDNFLADISSHSHSDQVYKSIRIMKKLPHFHHPLKEKFKDTLKKRIEDILKQAFSKPEELAVMSLENLINSHEYIILIRDRNPFQTTYETANGIDIETIWKGRTQGVDLTKLLSVKYSLAEIHKSYASEIQKRWMDLRDKHDQEPDKRIRDLELLSQHLKDSSHDVNINADDVNNLLSRLKSPPTSSKLCPSNEAASEDMLNGTAAVKGMLGRTAAVKGMLGRTAAGFNMKKKDKDKKTAPLPQPLRMFNA